MPSTVSDNNAQYCDTNAQYCDTNAQYEVTLMHSKKWH